MLTRVLAASILRFTQAQHPLVGWQPEAGMRMVPATFAGNESAMMAVGSGHCSEWWPAARSVLGKSLPRMLYASAIFVRCGHSVVNDSVASPRYGPDAVAARDAAAFAQELGVRAYAVIEWSSAVKNLTRFAESVETLRQKNWSGVALLTTESSRGVLQAAEAAHSVAPYDTVVVVDMNGTIKSSPVPLYSRDSLVTDMSGNDEGQRGQKKSIVDIHRTFSELRNRGFYRVCLVVDVLQTSRELFQTYAGFAAQFRGAHNYPWLALASPPLDNNNNDNTSSEWHRQVEKWRVTMRKKLSFGENYWSSPTLLGPQVMIHDRFLSDRGNWTADRFLQDLEVRYGGVDSVLLWHSYPNIGVDDRNQFDMLEDVQDLESCVRQFHNRGVKVLLPYNPWNDLRNESVETMLDIVRRVGADGINGDTMYGMPWNAASSETLLEPECGADQRNFATKRNATGPDDGDDPYRFDSGLLGSLSYDQTTWNYYPLTDAGVYATGKAVNATEDVLGDPKTGFLDVSEAYKKVIPGLFYGPPLTSRYKMLDARHNPIVCDRWSTRRLNGFHHSFFNAGGYATWENVWGIWNGLSDRDAQITRQISHLQRFLPDLLFSDSDFTPYVEGLPPGIYGSTLRNETITVHLIVNRRGPGRPSVYEDPATVLPDGRLSIPRSLLVGKSLFDLWNGRQMVDNDHVKLEHGGFGAIAVLTGGEVPEAYLAQRRELTRRPLATYEDDPKLLNQTMVSSYVSPLSSMSKELSDVNTTLIPGGPYHFQVHGIQVEGYGGLPGPSEQQQPDVQFEWETHGPRRFHARDMVLGSFRIDTFPVTNALYLEFLNSSGYRPTNAKNFLRHLHGEEDDKLKTYAKEEPVRWVSLDDAREFCYFYGKRLPHSWEWSRVATGASQNSSSRRVYPWGNDWDDEAVPRQDSGDRMLPPPKVGTHPRGQSPEGVHDLVGTIWQWSDEFCDDHTCRAIIRGGSTYRPRGSAWYLHHSYRNDQQNTLLLFSDALDRSGAVGFRCLLEDNEEEG